jgi:hypothetical protein
MKETKEQPNQIRGDYMKYYYAKRCKSCNAMYYKKEIIKEQADNLADNPDITFEFGPEEETAVIYSCCSLCVKELYDSESI